MTRERTRAAFIADTWLPTVVAVGLLSISDAQAIRLAGLTIPGRLVSAAIALIATPFIWWHVTRRNPRSIGRAAFAGAILAAIFCAVPTVQIVIAIAKHGTGKGMGGLATMGMMFLAPVIWVMALLIGTAIGALIGVAQRHWRIPAQFERASSVAGSRELRSSRSALGRWLDQGHRRTAIEVMGFLLSLPLAAIAAFGYIAFEWKRTEVHVEGVHAIATRSNRVAVAFGHRWQWWPSAHAYDVRVSEPGDDPIRGRVVWESDKVPITSLEWTDQDSLLVHVDMHNDEFVPWLMGTMKTHHAEDVALRTVVKLTPDYLMVTNPPVPDDLQVRPEDIHLGGLPVSAGDSVLIHATIHNLGVRPAMGVDVEFFDYPLGNLLGKRYVDVAPGESTSIDMPWIAAPPDTHVFLISVSPFVFAREADYKNNAARVKLVLSKRAPR
jgi:hypothetical protein